MKKPNALFTLNVLAFTCLLFLASSGLQLEFVLKQGTTTWGLSRHTWLDIHFWTALTFLGVIVAHVAVHWKWIRAVVKGRNPGAAARRNRIALLLAVVLIAVAISPFFLTQDPPRQGGPRTSERASDTSAVHPGSDHPDSLEITADAPPPSVVFFEP